MSKKLLFGVLMICAVAALVAIGTWAYFSDVETSTGNVFTAGTLDLKINGLDDPYVLQLVNIEAMPSETVVAPKITVKNAGQNAGIFDLHFKNVVDYGGLNPEPEQVYETANGIRDDISNALFVDIEVDYDQDGVIDQILIPDYWVTLGRLESIRLDFPYALNASASWDLYLSFHLCANVDNWGQGDYTTFDIEFTLHQVNAPVPPIPVAWPLPLPAAGVPIPPGPGMTYPQFDAWMLAMDDYLGKVLPFTCDIVGIQQPDEVQPLEEATIAVDVHNVGDVSGECMLTVVVTDEGGNTVYAPEPVSTGILPPCETIKVPIGSFVVPEDLAGQTLTVTAVCDKDKEVCSIDVLKPFTLEATGIDQPPVVELGKDLSISVGVRNAGDKSGTGTVTLTIKSEGNVTLVSEPKSTDTLPAGGTGTVGFGPYTTNATWLGVCTVTTDPPLPKAHTVVVPVKIEVTGIQQPPVVELGTELYIAVDVHNADVVPGRGAVMLTIVNIGSGTPLVNETKPTPVLNPCDTAKVLFGPYTMTMAWLGVCYVATTPPLPSPPAPHYIMVVPPYIKASSTWNYDVNYLLGTPAGEALNAEVTAVPEALDAHVTTTLVGGPVTITVGYISQRGEIGRTTTVIIPADSGVGTTIAVTLQGLDTGVEVVGSASNDVALTAGEVEFVGHSSGTVAATLDLTEKPGDFTAGDPLGIKTGGAVTITVKYTDQDGNLNQTGSVTIPADTTVGTKIAVTLAAGDTVLDVTKCTIPAAVPGGGAVALEGAGSELVAGTVQLAMSGVYYTDGMKLYALQDTQQTTHLVELYVPTIPDMIASCTKVLIPLGPAAHVWINPAVTEDPIRPIPGTSMWMTTTRIDAWGSLTDGTSQYVYLVANLLGSIGMEVEIGYHDYVLTSGVGTNIGKPYTVGSSWTFTGEQEGYAMGSCSSYASNSYTCSVVASGVSVTVPAGTFIDCFEIVTDNTDADGTKTDYWSTTAQGIVKTVDTETYFPGVETTVLTSYTLVW
jgi:predicted ribosomally synthesized peptide with SipW-like signal peptide